MFLRTTAILNDASISDDDKAYVKLLTDITLKKSRKIFKQNAKLIGQKYDRLLPKLSDEVAKRDGYGLDIVKF